MVLQSFTSAGWQSEEMFKFLSALKIVYKTKGSKFILQFTEQNLLFGIAVPNREDVHISYCARFTGCIARTLGNTRQSHMPVAYLPYPIRT